MVQKILVVDDEPSIVISLEFLMKQNGYEVGVARTGSEALAAVESFEPDLILLDVMLPQQSGFEVCQVIRNNPARREVKIILLTARGREKDVLKGMELGADAYVTKPFSTKELVAKVREFLGG